MDTKPLKHLAARLSGDNDIECKFSVRDITADHDAVILCIQAGDDGIGIPLTREAAEEIAHALVMPFRRAHLARETARLLSESDAPQPDEGPDHAKPH